MGDFRHRLHEEAYSCRGARSVRTSLHPSPAPRPLSPSHRAPPTRALRISSASDWFSIALPASPTLNQYSAPADPASLRPGIEFPLTCTTSSGGIATRLNACAIASTLRRSAIRPRPAGTSCAVPRPITRLNTAPSVISAASSYCRLAFKMRLFAFHDETELRPRYVANSAVRPGAARASAGHPENS